MTKLDIQILIDRYNANLATDSELAIIEKMVESGKIQLDDLKDIKDNLNKLEEIPKTIPTDKADAKFYEMLAAEMRKQTRIKEWSFVAFWQRISQPQRQWAYNVAMLLAGSFIGFYVLNGLIRGNQIEKLTAEMQEMKQVVLLNMLNEESSNDRIKAVSLYANMDDVNDTVALALIKSLRGDANVNVRLAAVEALARYTDTPLVRKELIGSIVYQDSPLVQLALAELMVAMQEKNAVKEFDKIIQRQETPEEIKTEISNRMNTII